MANHQARSFVPALPVVVAQINPAPFSAAVLKDIRINAGAVRPSPATFDKVGRYGLVQFPVAADIVNMVNQTLPAAQHLDTGTAIANFDCYIEGIGTAVAYLQSRNGQHLNLASVIGAALDLDEDSVEEIFASKLFPHRISRLCVDVMMSNFGISHLKVVQAAPSENSRDTPRGSTVKDCLKLLI